LAQASRVHWRHQGSYLSHAATPKCNYVVLEVNHEIAHVPVGAIMGASCRDTFPFTLIHILLRSSLGLWVAQGLDLRSNAAWEGLLAGPTDGPCPLPEGAMTGASFGLMDREDLLQKMATSRLEGGKRLILLIGEQKSGTTALFDLLTQHPVLIPGKEKELHFFDFHLRIDECRMNSYINQFPSQVPNFFAWSYVDGTPDLLCNPIVARNTAELFPGGVRLLAVLRDPIERAHAAWDETRRAGWEARSFPEAIVDEFPMAQVCGRLAAEYFTVLDNATALDQIEADYFRKCVLVRDRRCWLTSNMTGQKPHCKQYLMKGFAAFHARVWQRHHGMDAIHFVRSKDYYEADGAEDSGAALSAFVAPIFNHLRLPAYNGISKPSDGGIQGCDHHCDMLKTNVEDVLDVGLRIMMQELYQDTMERLPQVTGLHLQS